MVLNRFVLVLVLKLLHGVNGTMVKLNNGGFENIVVAINPELQEDQKIVDNIKDMIREASTYLFSATQNRFYFKTAKVIIPLTWKSKSEYKRLTIESYGKADVIVADRYLKYGDQPYTLQYGGCGEKGRYIHFTPNFLTNDNSEEIYGPRGRIFVHEWAHLRWGVFDEYNSDAPFYVTGPSEAEATRCSAAVTGKYVFRTSAGKTRTCKIDGRTGLYEAGCEFVPDRRQRTPASIMYTPSLPSVTQFCDKSNHNIQATNLQNKLCNYRSTWDVIMDSADFVGSSPMAAPPPAPTISLLQAQDRVVCLVLDVSESMNLHDRINRLRQAAELFLLQIFETSFWVGIVTYSNYAEIKAPLQQIVSDSERISLTTSLPTTASGGTSICSGVRAGFQVFLQQFGNTEGYEMVLLTAGDDSAISSCFGEVERSGSRIHTIALGPSAARELEMLSDMTGGLKFSATGSLDSNGLIDAFCGISSASGSVFQQTIQDILEEKKKTSQFTGSNSIVCVNSEHLNLLLTSVNSDVVAAIYTMEATSLESKRLSIGPSRWMHGIVSIDRTVGNDTTFVVTWSVSTIPPSIFLMDPRGKPYPPQTVFEIGNVRMALLRIGGTAEVGDWTYKIQNKYSKAQVISMTVTTRAASSSEPPVTVKPYMNIDTTNNYPNPMVVYAEVNQGFLPMIGANVTATVEPESGPAVEFELLDDGTGADILKHDGIYSRYFTSYKGNGRYNVKVRVRGEEKTVRRIRRQSQAMYVPGYIEDDGKITMHPPRPKEEGNQTQSGTFSTLTNGGSFIVTDMPPGYIEGDDIFPPMKIKDLRVVPINNGEKFLLSWTAPGDDYDDGTADRYEIKMSEDHEELRDATFENAASVNTSGLKPAECRTKESFLFKPENPIKKNEIYFAIRAIDEKNNVGRVSNAARAVMPMYPPRTTLLPSTAGTATMHSATTHSATATRHSATATTHSNLETMFTTASHNESKSVTDLTLIVIIVCASAIFISAIVSITICLVHKRNYRRPETGMSMQNIESQRRSSKVL